MIRLYDSCTYVHTAVRHIGLYFLISDVGRKNKGGRLVVCLVWPWKVFVKDGSHSKGETTPWWALGRSPWSQRLLVRICAPRVGFCPKQNHHHTYSNWQFQVSVWDLSLLSISSGEVWIYNDPEATLGFSTTHGSLLSHYHWVQCPDSSDPSLQQLWDGDVWLAGSCGDVSGGRQVWMCLDAF